MVSASVTVTGGGHWACVQGSSLEGALLANRRAGSWEKHEKQGGRCIAYQGHQLGQQSPPGGEVDENPGEHGATVDGNIVPQTQSTSDIKLLRHLG